MRPKPMDKTAQAPTQTPDLVTPAESGTLDMSALATADPTPKASQAWDSAAEQAWSEHSATAWVLAHVIHQIRSTPLPPFLLPEQRQHFHKIVQAAAALIEDWQRRERDQAQQLASSRPVGELTVELTAANQNGFSPPPAAEAQAEQEPSPSRQTTLEKLPGEHGADEANQHHEI